MTQRNELLQLLQKYEELFNGILGILKTDPVYFELKENVKAICSEPYPVLKVHEENFKKEVERLVLLLFLEVAIDLEQGYPTFAHPKPKSNLVRFPSILRI